MFPSRPIYGTRIPMVLLCVCVAIRTCEPAAAGEPIDPGTQWTRVKPAELGLDAKQLDRARRYALTGGGSGLVIYKGRLVLQWGNQKRRYDLKSSTKSIGITSVGLALKDGKIRSLHDPVRTYHPTFGTPPKSNAASPWLGKITLWHLATQTAGFGKPGGYTKLEFAPGTKWQYSDGGPNWLAECVTLQYKRDLQEVMFDRVFALIGITRKDLFWRRNAYRPREIAGVARREFGAGVHANANAMARIGYLYLRRGRWGGAQILTPEFVDLVSRTPKGLAKLPVARAKDFSHASAHYGLLWWNNNDGTLAGVPRDAYWSWGLYDSLILVVPSLDLVASRAGRSWKRTSREHYDVLKGFFEPLVRAVPRAGAGPSPSKGAAAGDFRAARPESASGQGSAASAIRSITWAPATGILRLAPGSDNWPATWGDDGALYTAYGDGWGFAPRRSKKLSLGLGRVRGTPPNLKAENIPSPTGDQYGDGPRGRKASGLLMVGGVLYMAVRNADGKGHKSTLAWSPDHGKTWTWATWQFAESFGYPTFLNVGPNYAGARDTYVYLYSHDSADAYKPADRMVLARAPKARITRRDAWEFFVARREGGLAEWSGDIARRGAVLTAKGLCRRSGVSYCPARKRYLWVLTHVQPGRRGSGGLSVYDAPEPWGPWALAWRTRRWDADPGETASFPPKWMAPDGRTMYLLHSGNDSFSVRRAEVAWAAGAATSE